jgi:hypothetical protein
LDSGDKVLMNESVEYEACTHGVGR